jgi:hypothetical protein
MRRRQGWQEEEEEDAEEAMRIINKLRIIDK